MLPSPGTRLYVKLVSVELGSVVLSVPTTVPIGDGLTHVRREIDVGRGDHQRAPLNRRAASVRAGTGQHQCAAAGLGQSSKAPFWPSAMTPA